MSTATLFISHSSQDRVVALRVAARLAEAGYQGIFLDIDPEAGIPAGRSWERELHAQLRRADAVIYLASAASAASHWCFAELSHARAHGSPVFPVRLDDAPRLRLLEDVQWVDLRAGESALDRLLNGLRRTGIHASGSFAWDATRSPYPGLEPFAPQDAAVFFGREPETGRLMELLQPTVQYGSGRFVAVVGPSGSGKSSLLHAGVLPRLSNHRWVVLPPLRPGRQPTAALADSLHQALVGHGLPAEGATAGRLLGEGSAALVELAGAVAHAEGALSAPGRSVLLVIDQAEELLTLTGVEEQKSFLRLLTGALGTGSPLWVLATVRSEFLTTSPERAGLTEAIDDPLVLEPLSRDRLPEVIELPARQAGLVLAPGLTARMVDETVGGDALSLLAYTLRALYARVGREGVVTVEDYEAVGGVEGALRRRADALREELTRRGQGEAVLPALLRLVTVDGDKEPSARRVPAAPLSADERTVMNVFAEARLLVRGAVPGQQPSYEVAHEALLRRWPPLHAKIAESRHFLRLRSELERLAADWERGAYDESYLLRGGRLGTFTTWSADHPKELSPLEERFVAESRSLAERERVLATRSQRRRRRLKAGLVALLVLALTAGALAYMNSERAQSRARLALADRLGAQSDAAVGSRPAVAVLVGLQSLSVAHQDRTTPRPPGGLVTGLARLTHTSTLLPHPDRVQGVDFAPDGTTLATCGYDGAVHLWDTAGGDAKGKPLRVPGGAVTDVAFAPAGTTLATGSEDGTIRLWDVRTRRLMGRPLVGHQGLAADVEFRPGSRSRLLASAGSDGTVRLWDVRTHRTQATLRAHDDAATSVAFSPDGRLLATAGWDRTARLWSVGKGAPQQLRTFTGHRDWLRRVAFAPDGATIATSSADGTARVWNVRTGRPEKWHLSGHGNDVWSVAYSPDGRLLATAEGDGTTWLWSARDGTPRGQALAGHTNLVNQVDFAPDSKRLATSSWDKSARLWSVAESYSVARPLTGHRADVNAVAFDRDSRLLATAGDDGTVRLWRTGAGEGAPRILRGHSGPVYRVAFSPRGDLIVSVGADGTARLWRSASGKAVRRITAGRSTQVRDVSFSPDGKQFATASMDSRVRIWSTATGRAVGKPLSGHDEPVNGVAYAPHGALLADVSNDTTGRLWNVRTRTPRGASLEGHTNIVNDVAFSPDGRLVATAGADLTVRLWNVPSGRLRGAPLTGSTGTLEDVAFSPDGSLVAGAGDDGAVRMWNVRTGRTAGFPLTGHRGEVYGVAFSPDGRFLASAGADGTARLWDRDFTDWVGASCRVVNRNLTAAEWRQYIPQKRYERTCPNLPAGQGAPPHAPAADY
ncbi:TIR domain-containing protein [Streptomyces kunmingensis]|uniref:TIR domain-containing protein n=1 Tax=Streptomyces kunmingensis TaxID=68225 RepID=A0ABU6CF08_9ACTN|nr:TIR domain-containing protein [Streptomyces kunmingensis]MEB3963207.1 TIR domain-containing protein [Streptomyces kunmingensis]